MLNINWFSLDLTIIKNCPVGQLVFVCFVMKIVILSFRLIARL